MEIKKILVGLVFTVVWVQCNEVETNENDVKVLVDYTGTVTRPNPGIKPTAKPVHHEPGIPPSGTGNILPIDPVIQKPNRPILNNNNNNHYHHPHHWFSTLFGNNHNQGHRLPENLTEYMEVFNATDNYVENFTVIESEPLILRPNSHNLTIGPLGAEVLQQEPNKGVIDWVLGLVGIQTQNGNGGNKPQTPEPIAIKNCAQCRCGESFKHTRIVGGIETQVNAYPWMTILTYNGRFYCGASVINNKYLLTATHCVNGFNKDRLQAVFLDHDRGSTSETTTFTRKISAILKHRGYNMGGSYNNDIALLRLDSELKFNGLLRPVCLPSIGKSYTGYTGIATGWGATEEHGQVSNKLREVEVPIMSNVECRKTGYGTKITDNMLCAGYKKGMKDSCQGDSGGPLHIINKTLHTIVGIVSWGEGCAEANYPGVYTRVNRYISWIKSNTKDACYCS